jgi:8-amino-7-oxononanoate synthase
LSGKNMEEEFLRKKINDRRENGALRQLRLASGTVDFSSNDYLGIATNHLIDPLLDARKAILPSGFSHGATGSRLLSGNYPLISEAEQLIAQFHDAPAALIFNSGYDANLGLLSCVPRRGDTILFDQLSHASIRDGIRLSFAHSHAFGHNDLVDLENKLERAKANIFVVTESVFSMDGDLAPLKAITVLCDRFGARLIVDEAHSTGIIGKSGEGLVQELGLQQKCFARIHTFGKALGCHGAVVLGTETLQQYLINFSRPFIYTTALPEINAAAIAATYHLFPQLHQERARLKKLIYLFREGMQELSRNPGNAQALITDTAIQGLIVPGNDAVKKLSQQLADAGLDVRPILYPTVPKGSERLRIVLHSYNTEEELHLLLVKLLGR